MRGPVDLAPLLAPQRAGLVVFECLEGVIGPSSRLPGLAAAAAAGGMVAHVAALLDAARSAGVRVFYCTLRRRADGVGQPGNTPLEQRLRRQDPRSTGALDLGGVVPELAPREGDVVVCREHGLTGFFESGLDAYLRHTGVATVVLTGVSVNIGVLGTAIEAVNRGYTVVVPSDCVAGDPPEYAEQVLRYTLRNVAYLTTSADVAARWSA